MMKAIPFSEVQRGQVVCKHKGASLRINYIGVLQDKIVLTGFFCPDENMAGEIVGDFNEMLGLLQWPRPEGKTDDDMLNALYDRAYDLSQVRELDPKAEELSRLRKALEAFDLGKPEVDK